MSATRLLLASALVAVALNAAPVARATQLNMPGDAVGNWVGGCTQTETQVHTNIAGQVMQQSPVLLMGFYQNTDTFFGCPTESHGGYPLFKNQKPNGWTAHSLYANPKFDFDDLLGRWHLKTKGTQISFKGKKACSGQGPKKYNGKGALTGGNQLTIHITAKIQGEFAHFECSWQKS